MKVGRMRHRISLEELIEVQDSDGAVEETWFAVANGIPAEIAPLSGREFVAAQAIQAEVNTRITIRYRPGLKPKMRAVHRETIFNIEAVLPDAKSGVRFVTLMCSSGPNAG